MAKWYKFLWKHIGGRPWTYIIRDFYHEMPIPFIMIEAWVIWAINYFWDVHWWVWLFISLGILLGHLFWSGKWIPGEGEKRYK